jgi:hypothetical protein
MTNQPTENFELILEGNQNALEQIMALFESGELEEILGVPVLSVESTESNDPITALTTFLESDDPVAMRVREVLENLSISEIVAQFNTVYRSNSATKLPYALVDILAGSTPTAQNKNMRSASEGSENIKLLRLARDLAKKLAEIWGNAE